jgi:calcineurin-like phosphoesterase family protein
MRDIWFTADFHLGHRNIIRYCGRPFRDVGEMDSAILDRLNAAAKERDILYFLGDFCLGGAKNAERYLDGVRCTRIFFVKGNHDRTMRKLQHRFIWLGDLAEVTVRQQRIVLCHYAMRTWNQASRGSWHLYGHSHGRLPEDTDSLTMDVGVDFHDFRPWHFDEIAARMRERRLQLTPEPDGFSTDS